MRKARRPAARTHAHETLLRFPMEGLRADVARLAFRVGRALRDRDRDRVLVLFLSLALFRAAAALDLITDLLVAALPVPFLAVPAAVARLTDATARRRLWDSCSARGAMTKHVV